MKNLPKISIITVSYNQAHCIEESILSVVEQDYPNIEYIIIDGKSTDGSLDIIKKNQNKIAYWVSEPDKGIYDAMNKGIKKATGDWIFFLGTDDKLFPNIISKVFMELVNPKEYEFIYGQVKLIPSGRISGQELKKNDFVELNICHQAIFTHKKVFEQLGYFETKYPIFADYVFNMKIFSKTEIRKIYIPYCISEYYELGASHNYQSDMSFFVDKHRLMKEYLDVDLPQPFLGYKMLLRDIFNLFKDKKYREMVDTVKLGIKRR